METLSTQERIQRLASISKGSHAFKSFLTWHFEGLDPDLSNLFPSKEFWINKTKYASENTRFGYIDYRKSESDKNVEFYSFIKNYEITTKMFVSPIMFSHLGWFSFSCSATDLRKLYDVIRSPDQGSMLLLNTNFDVLYIEVFDGISFYYGNWRNGISVLDKKLTG